VSFWFGTPTHFRAALALVLSLPSVGCAQVESAWQGLQGNGPAEARDAVGAEDDSLGEHPYEATLVSIDTCPLPTPSGEPERSVLGVRIRLTGKTPARVAANYFYASVLTVDGSRYLAGQPGCEPLLAAAPLKPGESAEGYVNVPIPSHKKPDRLQYLPPIDGQAERLRAVELPLDSSRFSSEGSLEDRQREGDE